MPDGSTAMSNVSTFDHLSVLMYVARMLIETFEMERMQSLWEGQVRYNLSESGVHALSLRELVTPDSLADMHLGYPQTNGSLLLRERIAALYSDATADHVLVTNGSAEANFLSTWSLVEPGDEVIVMLPNYMQIWGWARALGATMKPWHLQEGRAWSADLDELETLVTSKTKIIAICNPNNPTGAVMSAEAIARLCAIAGRVGAWIVSDEVYRHTERDGQVAASPWGRYDRVLVTCGLSKAYGLPGLRIGWVLGPPPSTADLWRYKDYATICPSLLSDHLACLALEPARHAWILERTRTLLDSQRQILSDWAAARPNVLTWNLPAAGAVGYFRYRLPINSTTLAERLRVEKDVLLVPGDQFGMDHFLRIGYGGDPGVLRCGLQLVGEVLWAAGN